MNGWRRWLSLLPAGALLIALAVWWRLVVDWTNSNGGLASWVQAVGSIIAIGSAAGLVLWQHELERRRVRESDFEIRKRRLLVIVELVGATALQAQWLQEKFSDRSTVEAVGDGTKPFDRRDINSLGTQIEVIPLHQLDDPAAVGEVLLLVVLCTDMREKITKALEQHRRMNAADFTNLFEALLVNAEGCEKIRAQLKDRVAALRM